LISIDQIHIQYELTHYRLFANQVQFARQD
jgi:hypothetical protein